MNTGPALGGPVHGQEIASDEDVVVVPVLMPGESAAYYRWIDGAWLHSTFARAALPRIVGGRPG